MLLFTQPLLVLAVLSVLLHAKFADRFNYVLHPHKYHKHRSAQGSSLLELKPVIDRKPIQLDQGITPEMQQQMDAREAAVTEKDRVSPRIVDHLEGEESGCKEGGCKSSLHESLKEFAAMTPEQLAVFEKVHGPSPVAPDAHLSSEAIESHLPVVPKIVESISNE